jgi:hypothetical protein
MNNTKYVGMGVHRESISIAVMNSAGKIVLECVVETKASIILQFIDGPRGDLHVTLEEGTWAGWLYDLLKPHVTKIMVCNPRRNALLKKGNKSDRIDAHKLVAEPQKVVSVQIRTSSNKRGGLGNWESGKSHISITGLKCLFGSRKL